MLVPCSARLVFIERSSAWQERPILPTGTLELRAPVGTASVCPQASIAARELLEVETAEVERDLADLDVSEKCINGVAAFVAVRPVVSISVTFCQACA